jgi:hypothetical protein
MSDITHARRALITRILEGDGMASHDQRRSAFANSGLSEPLSAFINKVATRAYTGTDGDITAVIASGLAEDQIFEIVVCAAIGQATRQYEAGLAALDAAVQNQRSK